MKDFARVNPSNAEKGVHEVLQNAGLSCPVQVEMVDLGEGSLKTHPYIKLSSWAQHLLDTKRFTRQMTGTANFHKMHSVLEEFWKRFRKLKPDHTVFRLADRGSLNLRSCIPYFSHTDEGRSVKHLPFWVLSSHGCLGRGTRAYLRKSKHKSKLKENGMGLNFMGKTWSTNFIFSCMLRPLAVRNPQALEELLKIYAADAHELMFEGVTSTDGRHHVWMVHLNTKGDLPALTKLGGFKRSFSHVAKASRSRKACRGICHLCMAGQELDERRGVAAIPFEDVSMDAAWIVTIGAELPWETEPPILAGLDLKQSDRITFFATDLWHNWHLGLARQFIASSIVCILESGLECLPAGSIETKLSFLSGLYRSFLAAKREAPFVPEISRDTLNWPQSSANPIGKWSKGSASTQMMLWLDDFGRKNILGKTDDEILLNIVSHHDIELFFWDVPDIEFLFFFSSCQPFRSDSQGGGHQDHQFGFGLHVQQRLLDPIGSFKADGQVHL